MKMRYTGWLVVPMVTLLLAGCTTTEQGGGMGALIGAGLGQAIGRDTKGTLIGAAAGGLIGTIAGAMVEGEQTQYAAREAELNRQIDTVETQIAQTRSVNNRLRVRVAELQQQLNALAGTRGRTEADTARLRQLVAAAEQQQHVARQQLAQVEGELRNAQSTVARQPGSPRAQELQTQIAALERERSQLQQTITQLASTTASVTL